MTQVFLDKIKHLWRRIWFVIRFIFTPSTEKTKPTVKKIASVVVCLLRGEAREDVCKGKTKGYTNKDSVGKRKAAER